MDATKKVTGIFIAAILVISVFAVFPMTASAASEAEIQQAIDDGIAWLAAQQNPEGSWGTSNMVGETGLAVKKLEHQAVDCKWGYCFDSPFDPAYPYADNVSRGLDYLFNHSHTIAIGPQTYGDPDTDGDGIGVYFGESQHHRNYETGIALMAIAESTTPDRVVDVPGSEVNGWTYYDVAVDTMNYLAWAQAETNGRGGWGYAQCDNGTWTDTAGSDNSNSGWVVLGLRYAETEDPLQGFNIAIPQFVKDELNIWIDYIQNDPGPADDGGEVDPDGGSGYTAPDDWVNILKTGNLLHEMAFVGDTKDTPRVINASDYICRHWNDTNDDSGWRPNNYHAMYTTMKGFVSLDIHKTCGHDWQADYEDAIVDQQNPSGNWTGCGWGDPILCTAWALLTLQKAAPPPRPTPPPTAVPALTPVGLIALVGLLSVIAAISISTRIKKRR
ncbi:hypothetical protein C5S30_00900 [ANME-1 cluster archaeon GoMg4]|nr:hypothetical protein [ANME-1 cluster archaeon GoMg4]